jgi:hypothetical protein
VANIPPTTPDTRDRVVRPDKCPNSSMGHRADLLAWCVVHSTRPDHRRSVTFERPQANHVEPRGPWLVGNAIVSSLKRRQSGQVAPSCRVKI